MYYLDLTMQVIAKMTLQTVPYLAIIIMVLATITAITGDIKWLINLFKRIGNI